MVLPVDRHTVDCDGGVERYKVAVNVPTVRVRDLDNRRPACRLKRVGQRDRRTIRRDISVRSAVLDIELQVRTDTNQVDATQGHPVPQRTAHPQIRGRGYARPPADLFGVALTEANLVALVPAPFIGVSRVFPVHTGLEGDFLEWHECPLNYCFFLS